LYNGAVRKTCGSAFSASLIAAAQDKEVQPMRMKKQIAMVLIAALLLAVPAGCSKKSGSSSGKANTDIKTKERDNGNEAVFELAQAKDGKESLDTDALNDAYLEFVFDMMGKCTSDAGKENVLISPDSVFFTMMMASAGANGETLDQMTETMVPGSDPAEALLYASDRMYEMSDDTLGIANSAWLNEKISDYVYEDYLNYVSEHFDAEVQPIAFDGAGVDKINAWVSQMTDGMIDKLIDNLSSGDTMVLANTITFDARWQDPYDEYERSTDYFRNGNGEKQLVDFLDDTEHVYFNNGKAEGFLKPYVEGNYAFMTILPHAKGVDINQFMSEMTAEDYRAFWNSMDTSKQVETSMPQFTSEFSVEMKGILSEMGMEDAFSGEADFSNMTSEKVFIGSVLHKTFIRVTPEGTQAAAATAAIMTMGIGPDDVIYVTCDRPFAYAIVDTRTGLPVFLGTVETVEQD